MKKVRGPTYMKSVWGCPLNLQRRYVEYNDYGQPIGGESSTLTHFLGSIARNGKYCPIDVKDWCAMSKENKTDMLELVKVIALFLLHVFIQFSCLQRIYNSRYSCSWCSWGSV